MSSPPLFKIKDFLAGVSLLMLVALAASLLYWQAGPVQAALKLESLPPTPDASATLLAVGDVMLGRGVQQSSDASPEKSMYPFSQILTLTANADLTFGNLESPLVAASHLGDLQTAGYAFPGRPSDAQSLKAAGFGLMTLANNHSLDFGNAGLQDTLAALKAAGVQYVGAGADKTEASLTRYVSVKGLRIAFIAATQAWPSALNPDDSAAAATTPVALFDQTQILNQIRTARPQADVVVVALHWGEEYHSSAADWQSAFVQEASAAGADLILGAHPHVLQQFEVVGHTVVAYSLGNFIFDPGWPPESKQSAALFVKLDKQGVAEAQVIPLRIENNRPRPLLPTERAAGLAQLATLTTAGSAFTTQATFWNGSDWQSAPGLAYVRDADPTGKIKLPSERTIEVQDITGPSTGYADGLSSTLYANAPKVPERIQLDSNHTLRVWRPDAHDNWQLIWQSPADWIVMQFSFADADNDARPELMFTLWKNTGWDDADAYRSHPFVYGWRNVTDSHSHTQYPAIRPVWAGSVLAAPFREFALSDFKNGTSVALDGAKNQLVVLEGSYAEAHDAPAHSLLVFEWNGWGYSLEYRSPPGNFNALSYAPAQPYIFYKAK
jgi:poly-gamma-glutamate synthesis protein (capsule biosynthesis protein)